MVSNYFIKSCTACGKTTHKENLKLSQDHLNKDALKPQCKVSWLLKSGITKKGQKNPVKGYVCRFSPLIFPNLGHLECYSPH